MSRSDNNLPNAKRVPNSINATAVIQVRMRHKQPVNVTDASPPQERQYALHGDTAAAAPCHPRIEEQDALMGLHSYSQALPDVEDPGIETTRRRRRGSPGNDCDDAE